MNRERIGSIILLPHQRGSTLWAFAREAKKRGLEFIERPQKPSSIFPEHNYPADGCSMNVYLIWTRGSGDRKANDLARLAVRNGGIVGLVALIRTERFNRTAQKWGVDAVLPDETEFSVAMNWLTGLYEPALINKRSSSIAAFPWNNR